MKFRQYGVYESVEPIKELHQLALGEVCAYVDDPQLDTDLESPASYYPAWGGEFWVGELDDKIVAMGAFRMFLSSEANQPELTNHAELKRMRVHPDLQEQGIGTSLLKLLESRAAQQDYKGLVLDTVVGTPAQKFYERHGYQEIRRQSGENVELVYFHKDL